MFPLTDPLLPRRRLLGLLAVASPSIVALRRRAAEAVRQIDRSTLSALADVALPASIGPDERARTAAGFEQWLAAYRGGAELLHGYGSSEIRRAPPSPAPKWRAQLQRLDEAARRRHARAFAELDRPAATALLEAALQDIHTPVLPAIATAPHVALGLLAFWVDLPAGYDQGYGGRVGRFGCRPLAKNPGRPEPLAGGS